MLDDEDLSVLEYREDLEYFYVDSYADELNVRIPCVLMSDVIEQLEAKGEAGERRKKGVFYFTHSGTVLKLLAHLGLFKEEVRVMTHDNAKHQGR